MPQLTAEAQETLARIWQELAARTSGPLEFRFVLQPVMAGLLAIRDGIKDARTGRPPYFWTVLSNRAERNARLKEGLSATARIIVLGLVMDAIYQFLVLRTIHPLEAIIVALGLAFVPYLLLRGPADRLARWWQRRSSATASMARRRR